MSVAANSAGSRITRNIGATDAGPITVACWFRFVPGANQIVWSFGQIGSFEPAIFVGTGPDLTYVDTANNQSLVAATPGVWTWVAAVFNGLANPVVFYIGVAGAPLSVIPTANPFGGVSGPSLSFFDDFDTGFPFLGPLTAIKVWSRALGADEIANEYLRFAPSTTDDLLAFMPTLNKATLGIDQSGNGNDFAVSAPADFDDDRAMPPSTWTGAL